MSAAEACFITGRVSLIGWGEAGLEPGLQHWGPGKNRDEGEEAEVVVCDKWNGKEQGKDGQKTCEGVLASACHLCYCLHLEETSGK